MNRVRASQSVMLAALVALCGAAWVPSADAQWAPNSPPRFGTVALNQRFSPDPNIVRGQAGGNVAANRVNNSCRGYISPQPSHVIRSRSGIQMLSFVVQATEDTTIMVQLPNGQVVCDDDHGGDMNPLVQVPVPRGDTKIWVGSYNQRNVGIPYQLGLTTNMAMRYNNLGQAAVATVGITPQARPRNGTARLQSGFRPDPHIMAGVAGGPIAAQQVHAGCRGFISPQPNHVVTSRTGFQHFRAVVNAGELDTTLLVQLPNGQILCDDDGASTGLHPLIATTTPAGAIRIWVGTYANGASGSYNIGFSEIPSVDSPNIPPPGGVPVRPPVVTNPNVNPPVNPPVAASVVPMQATIPVTLIGPGMTGTTVAVWSPEGGQESRIQLTGNTLMVNASRLGVIPPEVMQGVVTVTQRRDGKILVRAERAPGGSDPGQQVILLLAWNGRPTIEQRWEGTFRQTAPRWTRRR